MQIYYANKFLLHSETLLTKKNFGEKFLCKEKNFCGNKICFSLLNTVGENG